MWLLGPTYTTFKNLSHQKPETEKKPKNTHHDFPPSVNKSPHLHLTAAHVERLLHVDMMTKAPQKHHPSWIRVEHLFWGHRCWPPVMSTRINSHPPGQSSIFYSADTLLLQKRRAAFHTQVIVFLWAKLLIKIPFTEYSQRTEWYDGQRWGKTKGCIHFHRKIIQIQVALQ